MKSRSSFIMDNQQVPAQVVPISEKKTFPFACIKQFVIVYLICQVAIFSFIPGVPNACKQYQSLPPLPPSVVNLPVGTLVTQTVDLAERLSRTNVSVSVKLAKVDIGLADLE